MKLLSGASTKRKPRGSPPASPTLDAELGAELSCGLPGAPCACPGPCDADAVAPGPQRRACSLDSAPVAPPPRQPCSSLGPAASEVRPAVCERWVLVMGAGSRQVCGTRGVPGSFLGSAATAGAGSCLLQVACSISEVPSASSPLSIMSPELSSTGQWSRRPWSLPSPGSSFTASQPP